MSSRLFHVPSTSSLRPDICPSRSSLDSGFESAKSKSCSGPSSPHSSGASVASTLCKTTVSPLVLQGHTAKKPKLDLGDLSTSDENLQNQPEDLATKLINSCTSPRSTANVRRLLLYCTPSTSAVPVHGKKSELKNFIFEKFGEKKLQIEEEISGPEIGTFGDCGCLWNSCAKKFPSETDLYDHLIEHHLIHLRSNFSTETLNCQWDDCELSIARGDVMKKYNWLVSHITLKHLPLAQPHKCFFGECVARFRTSAQLANHFKVSHKDLDEEKNPKKSVENLTEQKEVKTESNSENLFYFFYGRKIPKNQIQDNIDRRMFDWLHDFQIEVSKMKNPLLKTVPSENYRNLRGSKRRKTHFDHFIDLVEESQEKNSEKFSEKISEKFLEKISEKFSEKFSEKISEKFSEKSSEKSSEKFSEKSSEKNSEKNSEKIVPQLSPIEARFYFKKIFSKVKNPQYQPQEITLDGIRYKLEKKSKKIFKTIKTEGKIIKIHNASDHHKITDMTFDQAGKDLMDYWIKVDDEKFGKI